MNEFLRSFVMPEDEGLALCAKECKDRQKLGLAYCSPDECDPNKPCSDCVDDASARMPGRHLVPDAVAESAMALPGFWPAAS